MVSHAKRVKRGAAYMDACYPGWHTIIDLRRLSVASSEKCVLGQADVAAMARRIQRNDEDVTQAVRLDSAGFMASFMGRDAADDAQLTAAWKVLIKERRKRGSR